MSKYFLFSQSRLTFRKLTLLKNTYVSNDKDKAKDAKTSKKYKDEQIAKEAKKLDAEIKVEKEEIRAKGGRKEAIKELESYLAGDLELDPEDKKAFERLMNEALYYLSGSDYSRGLDEAEWTKWTAPIQKMRAEARTKFSKARVKLKDDLSKARAEAEALAKKELTELEGAAADKPVEEPVSTSPGEAGDGTQEIAAANEPASTSPGVAGDGTQEIAAAKEPATTSPGVADDGTQEIAAANEPASTSPGVADDGTQEDVDPAGQLAGVKQPNALSKTEGAGQRLGGAEANLRADRRKKKLSAMKKKSSTLAATIHEAGVAVYKKRVSAAKGGVLRSGAELLAIAQENHTSFRGLIKARADETYGMSDGDLKAAIKKDRADRILRNKAEIEAQPAEIARAKAIAEKAGDEFETPPAIMELGDLTDHALNAEMRAWRGGMGKKIDELNTASKRPRKAPTDKMPFGSALHITTRKEAGASVDIFLKQLKTVLGEDYGNSYAAVKEAFCDGQISIAIFNDGKWWIHGGRNAGPKMNGYEVLGSLDPNTRVAIDLGAVMEAAKNTHISVDDYNKQYAGEADFTPLKAENNADLAWAHRKGQKTSATYKKMKKHFWVARLRGKPSTPFIDFDPKYDLPNTDEDVRFAALMGADKRSFIGYEQNSDGTDKLDDDGNKVRQSVDKWVEGETDKIKAAKKAEAAEAAEENEGLDALAAHANTLLKAIKAPDSGKTLYAEGLRVEISGNDLNVVDTEKRYSNKGVVLATAKLIKDGQFRFGRSFLSLNSVVDQLRKTLTYKANRKAIIAWRKGKGFDVSEGLVAKASNIEISAGDDEKEEDIASDESYDDSDEEEDDDYGVDSDEEDDEDYEDDVEDEDEDDEEEEDKDGGEYDLDTAPTDPLL